MKHFNELTPAEAERLAILAEECAEVIQIIGKILRHGFESTHPDGGLTNRRLLEKEIGHINNAQAMCVKAHDIDLDLVVAAQLAKAAKVGCYCHHQS